MASIASKTSRWSPTCIARAQGWACCETESKKSASLILLVPSEKSYDRREATLVLWKTEVSSSNLVREPIQSGTVDQQAFEAVHFLNSQVFGERLSVRRFSR